MTKKPEVKKSHERRLWQAKKNPTAQRPEKTKPAETGGCPYAKKCGGCNGAGMPYTETLAEKQLVLRRFLSRYGAVEPIIGMKEPYHYRNKVHAVFGRSRAGEILCGTYEEKSHKIVPIETCLIEDEASRGIILTVRDLVKAFKLKIYDEDTRQGFIRHVLIRRGFATGEILVVLVAADSRFPLKKPFVQALIDRHPEITSIVLNINNRRTSQILGDKEIVLYGDGQIRDKLCGTHFYLSSQSFYQVNPVQTEILYQRTVELAGLTGKERVLDTYCGIGTIGMIAAEKAGSVTGIELNAEAVRDAVRNVKANGIKNVMILEGDAGALMTEMAREGSRFDVVFMDPPRSGAGETFLKALIKAAPKTVVYVSCNPETLARDLAYLTKSYTVVRICPVDMFPFTQHIETVVLLSKGNISSQNVRVEFSLEDMDMSRFQQGATYEQIQDWVQEKYGFHVSHLNIAQVKRKHGIIERENYNKPKSLDSRQPGCPEEKENAIAAALKHFQMI